MLRGTTPAYELTIPGVDLTSNNTVHITIEQWDTLIDITNERLTMSYAQSKTTILFRLTQLETLDLIEGEADIQVKWINNEGLSDGSKCAKLVIDKTLYLKPMTYEGG